MIPGEVRAALDAYRQEKTPERWTSLSQLWVGDVQVLDLLKRYDPAFPDPLALPVDGLIEESSQFFDWAVLPDPDDVTRALDAR